MRNTVTLKKRALEDQPLITSGEVARLLHVSPDTVRAWGDSGKLRATRTPTGRRMFSADEIHRLVLLDKGLKAVGAK